MKADLIKRLFKSIALGDLREIEAMAKVIISHEYQAGHTKLAYTLEKIINSSNYNADNIDLFEDKNSGVLSKLPRNKRNKSTMIKYRDPFKLEHEMILPKPVEKKFKELKKSLPLRKS